MADKHEVVHLGVEPFDPDRRVVLRSERLGLLNLGTQHFAPCVGRLTRPGLARVDDKRSPDAESFDGVTSHTGDLLRALVCEWSLRVFVLGLGLPVLNEIQLHGSPP